MSQAVAELVPIAGHQRAVEPRADGPSQITGPEQAEWLGIIGRLSTAGLDGYTGSGTFGQPDVEPPEDAESEPVSQWYPLDLPDLGPSTYNVPEAMAAPAPVAKVGAVPAPVVTRPKHTGLAILAAGAAVAIAFGAVSKEHGGTGGNGGTVHSGQAAAANPNPCDGEPSSKIIERWIPAQRPAPGAKRVRLRCGDVEKMRGLRHIKEKHAKEVPERTIIDCVRAVLKKGVLTDATHYTLTGAGFVAQVVIALSRNKDYATARTAYVDAVEPGGAIIQDDGSWTACAKAFRPLRRGP